MVGQGIRMRAWLVGGDLDEGMVGQGVWMRAWLVRGLGRGHGWSGGLG